MCLLLCLLESATIDRPIPFLAPTMKDVDMFSLLVTILALLVTIMYLEGITLPTIRMFLMVLCIFNHLLMYNLLGYLWLTCQVDLLNGLDINMIILCRKKQLVIRSSPDICALHTCHRAIINMIQHHIWKNVATPTRQRRLCLHRVIMVSMVNDVHLQYGSQQRLFLTTVTNTTLLPTW